MKCLLKRESKEQSREKLSMHIKMNKINNILLGNIKHKKIPMSIMIPILKVNTKSGKSVVLEIVPNRKKCNLTK